MKTAARIFALFIVLYLYATSVAASSCMDVFSGARNARSSYSLNLLPNTATNTDLIKTTGQLSYGPGDNIYSSGQLSGNMRLQTTAPSTRIYFTRLDISGTAEINSGPSNQLILLVDGDIAINGNQTINAIIYATGNINIGNNVTINGAITALGEITTKKHTRINFDEAAVLSADFATLCDAPTSELPDCTDVFPQAVTTHNTLELNLKPSHSTTQLDLYNNASFTLTAGDHFYDSGQVKDYAVLETNGRSARSYFKLFTTSSNALINTAQPENLILLVEGDVSLRDNTHFQGIIYATGNVSMSGSATVTGAITAGGVVIQNDNATVNYDRDAIEKADFDYLCNGSGTSSGNQFAFGRTTTNSVGGSVNFDTPFTNPPVVILMPKIDATNPENDGPSTLRISSVTNTGFHYIQEQPPGNDLSQITMGEIDWIAFAQGEGQLADGRYYAAGIVDINNYQRSGMGNQERWQTIPFPKPFTSTPAVFHQKLSQNNSCWITSVIDSVTTGDFNIALELSNVFDNKVFSSGKSCAPGGVDLEDLAPEQLGWVAISTGSGEFTYNNRSVQYQIGSGNTSEPSNSANYSLSQQCHYLNNFSQHFNPPPYLVAKKQTRLNDDGGWFRRCQLLTGSFSAVTDKDQYKTLTRKSKNEQLSYMALSREPAPSLPGLRFEHTQTDALSCDPHPVSVQALLDDQPDESYVGTISLTTDSGKGIWSLISGNGHFSGGTDNGVATYSYAAADKGYAQFGLLHTLEGALNINANDGLIGDTMAITFRPYGFRTSLDTTPLSTIIANTDNSITISAVGKSETNTGCEQIANYQGEKTISFWSDYQNPISTAGTSLNINGTAIGQTEAQATPQQISFTHGQASLLLNYPDAGQLKLNTKDADGIAPPEQGGTGGAIIGGSSFIVNPLQLYFSQIKNSENTENPQGTATQGSPFTPAGNGFTATLLAVMNKGSLLCNEIIAGSNLCTTPSFQHNNIVVSHQLTSPAGGDEGALNGSISQIATHGKATYPDLSFSEVGSIMLQAIADNYIQANNRIEGQSDTVGRFYPAEILLSHRQLTPACNNFTYLDQNAFGLSYQLQALNRGGELTKNYHSASYTTDGAIQLSASDGQTDISGRISHQATADTWQFGELEVTDNSLTMVKLAQPDGPFIATELGIQYTGKDAEQILDLDFNAQDPNCTHSSSCNAKSLGNAGDFIYGRLNPVNGFGSELTDIIVSQRLEMYQQSGNKFIVNDQDDCTQIANNHFSFDPSNGAGGMQIGAGSSYMSQSQTQAGLLPLTFSAPGEGNWGSGAFIINLLATHPWLRFDWDQDTQLNNSVTGSITFGIYKGSQRLIYKHENR